MLQLGFHQSWVTKVMACVRSVNYHVRQNGENLGPIKPNRGLRQGDPLSPFLFILCSEGLFNSLQALEQRDIIHGCKVTRGAPTINHLFFADDSYIFFNADLQECQNIKECLHQDQRTSGQQINLDKSAISFSSNIPELRTDIRNILAVSPEAPHRKYLGLLPLVGRDKKETFSFIKDRICSRLRD